MAELTIQPSAVRDALERDVESFTPETTREEVGRVTEVGDGIARVEGLHSAMTNELLEFSGGIVGLALNLDVREIGCVLLGDPAHIEEGQEVRRTGDILSVQAVDAMTAIGRGQRQLIIGDRQTGKSAIALDAIINQRDNWVSGDPKLQVKCIYVAIGQKGTTIAETVDRLEEAGALEYTTIVAAPASHNAGFKYLAAYTGSAIGQHWMYQGQHVLIVFDDLSKQAEAYRTIALLLRPPPGREAYPGVVFQLHSR